MIGRIRGELIEKQPPLVLIEAYGVGYEILTPMSSIYHLGETGKEVILYTHFVVREDLQQLYGFSTKSDRRLFQELIKVNGIGAKMALAILSGMDGATLVHCIDSKDHALLCSIPGIGKKTAERIVIELKDKLDKLTGEMDGFSSNITSIDGAALTRKTDASSEAVGALEALGYKHKDAQSAVKKVQKEGQSLEETIKLALQMAQKR
ncbi:Holliday junction branch migration protein RuvA [Fangia hongkongensis]|uniref:Holliday junction branch migration protein RuvA n=1 Tax=Fangia hongkongensis TaxID=270495 RepID=UPI00036C139E|nr:Holliday junction branch migration protein RuvA [Fangia hongkongensis]MBK2126100.1 Holliday junction branch migration protein RuvA [Fangia hongkongensis]